MNHLPAILAVTAAALTLAAPAWAEDPPKAPESIPIPHTGGYISVSPAPAPPPKTPPAMGGTINVSYPPAPPPTTSKCTVNGHEVPC